MYRDTIDTDEKPAENGEAVSSEEETAGCG
jgi:hypothetical protein